MRTTVPPFLLALYGAIPVAAGVHEVWWNLSYAYNVSPDGLGVSRRAIGVNGTWPPPPISVSANDTLVVHATNYLDNPSSLHHHGMFANKTAWYDGAVSVTQCGIPYGQTFTYQVDIPNSGQSGTYWVHAHTSGQYTDGLRAPFVIHPLNETQKYDDEYIVVLGDWYHTEHDPLLKHFMSIANPGGAEPVPDAPLMYFAHGDSYLPPIASAAPNVSPSTNTVGFNENATLPFEPGKTYRLRIVNTAAFAGMYFWIDGHEMRVIEVDGTDIEPYPVEQLNIAVAQRYSVLVTARNDTSSNWAVHANMDTDMFDKIPDGLNPNATSSITYSSSNSLTNLSPVPLEFYKFTDETVFVPLVVEPQLPPPDKVVELEVTFDTMDDGTNHAMFNSKTYNFPKVPTALTQVEYATQNITEMAFGELAFTLDHLSVVDIVVKNGDAGKHPFHIHGHQFQIVNRGNDYTSNDTTINPPLKEGQANPIRRDTIQLLSMQSATLRFVADNAGAWLFHCHIDWHFSSGLAAVFVEATPLLANAPVPQFLKDQCAALNLPTQGNAAGNQDPNNLKGLPEGPFPQILGWRPKGIGAMFGCVLTATLGMATVTWYAISGHKLTDEQLEEEVRRQRATRKSWKSVVTSKLKSG